MESPKTHWSIIASLILNGTFTNDAGVVRSVHATRQSPLRTNQGL